ncbi:MAG: 50S ribosomal protein L11 [Candidatus Gracilibacteria bacterium]
MAKKKEITRIVKLQITAGSATPAPPIGTALGPTGIQIADFCKQFNDKTRDRMGTILPTIITIYDDRSFTFEMREPPMTYLIKKALGLESGSATPHKVKVGKLTMAQLEAIAKEKMPDLNANDMEAAKMIVRGSARSMGIESE